MHVRHLCIVYSNWRRPIYPDEARDVGIPSARLESMPSASIPSSLMGVLTSDMQDRTLWIRKTSSFVSLLCKPWQFDLPAHVSHLVLSSLSTVRLSTQIIRKLWRRTMRGEGGEGGNGWTRVWEWSRQCSIMDSHCIVNCLIWSFEPQFCICSV